jgi:hypothetical protein
MQQRCDVIEVTAQHHEMLNDGKTMPFEPLCVSLADCRGAQHAAAVMSGRHA